MKYKSNYNVFYSCKYHVVFCPKYRRSVLVNNIDSRFKEIVLDLALQFSFDVLDVEVMPDHVHLLFDVDPQFGINNVIKQIKGSPSHILRMEFPCFSYGECQIFWFS